MAEQKQDFTDQEVVDVLTSLLELKPWDLMVRRTQARPPGECIIEGCREYDGGASTCMCARHEWKINHSARHERKSNQGSETKE